MNDAPGVETWKEHTSAFDRVRSVAETVSQPQSAATIADEALVAENTARKHLERLVDIHVLLQTDRGGRRCTRPTRSTNGYRRSVNSSRSTISTVSSN